MKDFVKVVLTMCVVMASFIVGNDAFGDNDRREWKGQRETLTNGWGDGSGLKAVYAAALHNATTAYQNEVTGYSNAYSATVNQAIKDFSEGVDASNGDVEKITSVEKDYADAVAKAREEWQGHEKAAYEKYCRTVRNAHKTMCDARKQQYLKARKRVEGTLILGAKSKKRPYAGQQSAWSDPRLHRIEFPKTKNADGTNIPVYWEYVGSGIRVDGSYHTRELVAKHDRSTWRFEIKAKVKGPDYRPGSRVMRVRTFTAWMELRVSESSVDALVKGWHKSVDSDINALQRVKLPE